MDQLKKRVKKSIRKYDFILNRQSFANRIRSQCEKFAHTYNFIFANLTATFVLLLSIGNNIVVASLRNIVIKAMVHSKAAKIH